MKKIISGFALILLFCCANAYSQCNTDMFTEKGIKTLMNEGGYTFLKSYPVIGETGKKYSYIFSNGTKYMIALANSDVQTKGIFIKLIDSNQNEVASTYHNGKFIPALAFTCSRTGVYTLEFSFTDTKEFCAAGVLGMKR